jgi:hypothetical protein
MGSSYEYMMLFHTEVVVQLATELMYKIYAIPRATPGVIYI